MVTVITMNIPTLTMNNIVTLSGTGGDYADFNVGDSIRPAGSSISSERGSITVYLWYKH